MPQQTTFNALAEVPSLTSKSTRSTPVHGLKRKQRGHFPGRGGSGRGRASHVGLRNSLRTNRMASRLAPACRDARANSVGCGCPRLRCCRKSSRFSRSDKGRAVSVSSSSSSSCPRYVSARKFLPVQVVISPPGGFWQPEENALAALSPGHMQSRSPLRFGMSVTPDWFARLSCGPPLPVFQPAALATW